MPKLDDGWNLVKLHEGRNSGVGEEDDDPMTSKSQLSIDIVSDDFNVDDDILSNTSSDDYAELSNSLRPRRTGRGARFVEDSFDTLTGSVASQTSQPERSGSKSKKGGLAGFMTKTFMPNGGNRLEDCTRKMWGPASFWKASFKIWHIILLSSLVSMFVFIGVQTYSPSIFNGIVKHVPTAAQIPSINNKNELLYGDISFLNHGETTVLSTWKPTGKYYVDFDNHIAYPIEQNDLIGLRKYKTDTVIFWYTTRAKVTTFWKASVIPSTKRLYQRAIRSIDHDVQWLQRISQKVQAACINSWEACSGKLQLFSEKIVKNAKTIPLNLSRKFRASFKRYNRLLQRAGYKTKKVLRKHLNYKFIKQGGVIVSQKYQRLLFELKSDIRMFTKSLRKGRLAGASKYNKNVAPQFKKWLTRSARVSKRLYKKALPTLKNKLVALRGFFIFNTKKGLYQHLKENLFEERSKFEHYWDQRTRELSFYKDFLKKSTCNFKNLTAQLWKSHVRS